ncbi:hypothetical protein H7R39_00825 [Campylobacter sp. Marseille-Q3452]|uniref:Uncharacterized protein n=1 Tax=Campylobacter massiliensis TaxID=2762557 RepID=A0A842J5H5_9BACT|nr:hypothetical protein [Campylobacter massiliensis]MBC2881835.1 hypothetical protein [Campylobacter massiliensis]
MWTNLSQCADFANLTWRSAVSVGKFDEAKISSFGGKWLNLNTLDVDLMELAVYLKRLKLRSAVFLFDLRPLICNALINYALSSNFVKFVVAISFAAQVRLLKLI